MIRVAQIGTEHSHAAKYRETLALFPDRIKIVGFVGTGAIQPQFADVPVFNSVDDLLNGVEIDAATVHLRSSEMGPALQALAAEGKHIWADKPVGMYASDLLPVKADVLAKGLAFTAGYQMRFYPTTRFVRQLVRDGLLGDLTFAQLTLLGGTTRFRDPNGPQGFLFKREFNGGGALHWLGCHFVDLLLAIVGEAPVEVTGVTAQLPGTPTEVEDIGSTILTFANGMIANLTTAYVSAARGASPIPSREPEPALYGQTGFVRWSQPRDEAVAYSSDPRWATSPWRVEQFHQNNPGGYGAAAYLAMTNFLDVIDGLAAPEYTIDQAIDVLRVIEAVYESAERKATVRL